MIDNTSCLKCRFKRFIVEDDKYCINCGEELEKIKLILNDKYIIDGKIIIYNNEKCKISIKNSNGLKGVKYNKDDMNIAWHSENDYIEVTPRAKNMDSSYSIEITTKRKEVFDLDIYYAKKFNLEEIQDIENKLNIDIKNEKQDKKINLFFLDENNPNEIVEIYYKVKDAPIWLESISIDKNEFFSVKVKSGHYEIGDTIKIFIEKKQTLIEKKDYISTLFFKFKFFDKELKKILYISQKRGFNLILSEKRIFIEKMTSAHKGEKSFYLENDSDFNIRVNTERVFDENEYRWIEIVDSKNNKLDKFVLQDRANNRDERRKEIKVKWGYNYKLPQNLEEKILNINFTTDKNIIRTLPIIIEGIEEIQSSDDDFIAVDFGTTATSCGLYRVGEPNIRII